MPKISRKIVITIPKKTLKTYQFYAGHFGLKTEKLMASMLYSECASLEDFTFGTLEKLDAISIEDPAKSISLAFLPEAYELFEAAAKLLRRPLKELGSGLLILAERTLANYITAALKGGGMDNEPEIDGWANESVKFEMAQKRGNLPNYTETRSAWQYLSITKPETKPADAIVKESLCVV